MWQGVGPVAVQMWQGASPVAMQMQQGVGPVLAQMWQGWAQSWRRCGEQRYRRGELARRIDGGAERGLVPCDTRKYALQRAEGRRSAM